MNSHAAMSREDPHRWLEVAEARAYADLYARSAALHQPLDAGQVTDGDVVAFWLGALDIGFFNRCIGLGATEPATEQQVELVVEAFRAAGRAAFVIQVSPSARPAELERWLLQRGLRPSARWAKLWRTTDDPPAEPSALRIEAIGPERGADFARVVLEAFEMPPPLGPLASATIGAPGWRHYLSFDGDMPIGAGAMRVEDGVAWLGFGSTLPSHRGRGSQSSLFARRLRDARDLGATLAVTETGEDTDEDPNPSFRNMRRAGFELAYLRRNWVPAPA